MNLDRFGGVYAAGQNAARAAIYLDRRRDRTVLKQKHSFVSDAGTTL